MDRKNVIKAWECCNPFNRKCNECPYEKDCYHDGISRHMVADALSLLKEQPEIIRCKDCTWWGTDGMCENSDSPCFQNGCTHGNWFCADGERQEGR